jgi:hypothetical protein
MSLSAFSRAVGAAAAEFEAAAARSRIDQAPLGDRLEGMAKELARRIAEVSLDRLRALSERAGGG